MTVSLASNPNKCSECGSPYLLQDHHTSYIPEITEPLCIFCHAKEHPGKANLILSNRTRQHRWDIPIHVLARLAGVSIGAVVLRAQRNGVSPGVLSRENFAILTHPNKRPKSPYDPPKQIDEIIADFVASMAELNLGFTCKRCGCSWRPRKLEIPDHCPGCSTIHWLRDKPGRKKRCMKNDKSKTK